MNESPFIADEPNEEDQQYADGFEEIREILPLNVLLQEMKQVDVKKRRESVSLVSTIAIGLGAEKSRALLLPFLQQLLAEEEEEIVMCLVSQLPALLNSLGGPAYGHLLMQVLFEQLLVRSEDGIRKEIHQSLRKLIGCLDIRANEKVILDALSRLLSAAPADTKTIAGTLKAKESYVLLMTEVYIGFAESGQLRLLELYQQLVSDKAPMVRRAVAKYLKDLVKLIPITPERTLRDIFVQLLGDENDQVRQQMIESLLPLWQLSDAQSSEEFEEFLRRIAEDSSWRVKASLIENFELIVESLSTDLVQTRVIPYIQAYLRENDSETKNKFLAKVGSFLTTLGVEAFRQHILPCVKQLTADKNIYVRANSGDALLVLVEKTCELKEIELILTEYLSACDKEAAYKFLSKVKDFRVLQNSVTSNIMQTMLSSLNTIISNNAKKWRIRNSSLQILQKIVRELTIQAQELSECFFSILLQCLHDKTFIVRQEAISVVELLLEQISFSELDQRLLAKLNDNLRAENNYLIRMGFAFIIKKICATRFHDSIKQHIPQILSYLAGIAIDRVPNVRLLCAEACANLAQNQLLKAIIKEFVKREFSGRGENDQDVLKLLKVSQIY